VSEEGRPGKPRDTRGGLRERAVGTRTDRAFQVKKEGLKGREKIGGE
jgi:hypothetical protein